MLIHFFSNEFFNNLVSFLYTDENFEIPFEGISFVIVQFYTNCENF